jgi:predicted ABC-type ATPase
MTEQKKIVIIAGPNGAGKTTFAREFLPFEARLPLFINADLIWRSIVAVSISGNGSTTVDHRGD